MSLFRLLTLLAMSLLTGCGFHLQGGINTPPEMQRTYIDAIERNSQFHRELRRQLLAADVELVDSLDEATAIFTISADETEQRVLTVSARNVPTEYQVYYSVEYALVSGEKSLLATQFVTLTRDYTYDETLVLGKAREEDLLRESIVRDLVRIVLKQISAL
jgi:LPS-assembly lipoprotein